MHLCSRIPSHPRQIQFLQLWLLDVSTWLVGCQNCLRLNLIINRLCFDENDIQIALFQTLSYNIYNIISFVHFANLDEISDIMITASEPLVRSNYNFFLHFESRFFH